MDERNSLYAFIHGDKVEYIGKTARTVRARFAGYQNPARSQRTNCRCNSKIRELLGQGASVRIFVFNPISYLRYGDFEINLAAGLEDALIEAFDPPWNGRELGRAITEEAEREELDEVRQQVPEDQPIPAFCQSSLQSSPSSALTFKILLGEAYYHQGIINPGAAASAYLGGDGEPVEVSFGDGTDPVISRIDRRANPGGYVRILGRNRDFARWFQRHFSKGETVQALVLDAHRIRLLPKLAAD
ncbi:GIY-YIG nuclease family protein [Acidocella facilis]|uniref:GIY-YIG nuclease family protein n=1 Tax=Acidocella facilis TaxID=525 RepID=UPI00068E7179|nr:GIY-YIG nuclease family protein [Acidocella facilis]